MYGELNQGMYMFLALTFCSHPQPFNTVCIPFLYDWLLTFIPIIYIIIVVFPKPQVYTKTAWLQDN